MRVIVCGGRSYGEVPRTVPPLTGEALERAKQQARAERERVFEVLDGFEITALAQGGASGADAVARVWADARSVYATTYRANWSVLKKAAGPIRNQKMLDDFKPDLVIAFPGTRGTADMVRRARRANIPVVEVTAL